ncbi:hypothetical protein GBF38_004881 [Nibea albiflora]|uniref:Uncharacterized protein n=1 Tax=Nibea albiflora TaxID=240163 RepID=A0ACB7F5F6_NIBAL|nr:hypothetical protein GBF38_004881 [Nibea albiflora]
MAALFIFAAWFLLVRQTFARHNNAPCLPSRKNGYNTFVSRHIRSDIPNSLDRKVWENYIERDKNCSRPTQSFLQQNDQRRVKDVCTAKGGVIHRGNLCLSRQPFTFVTVKIDKSTCSIEDVREETKHLILACDRLDNQCLPVHFEGNPENLKPNNNDRPCQAKVTTTTASSYSRKKLKPGGSGGRLHVPRKTGYNTFVRLHFRSDTPNSLDQNEWENYIESKKGPVGSSNVCSKQRRTLSALLLENWLQRLRQTPHPFRHSQFSGLPGP